MCNHQSDLERAAPLDLDTATDPPPPGEGLSRRKLLQAGTAALAATAWQTQTALAGPPQDPSPNTVHNTVAPPPAMRSSAHQIQAQTMAAGPPSLPPVAVIVLNRMAFGPRPEDWALFEGMGGDDSARLAAYVEWQLNPQAIDDSACDAILASRGYTILHKSLEQLWADHVLGGQDRYLPMREVQEATLLRAVYSKRQLVEVLADHWHNHFNIYGLEFRIAPVFVHYDRDVIRANLLGNFRQMLGAVAKSPAMLYYLDNQSNSGDRPNENYARELFELHVMGAENYLGVRSPDDPALVDDAGNRIGYIDSDVYGATTCFTGWRVNEETGLFTFDEARHFPYAKFVLGKMIPEFQGIRDGETVLDMLATHPGSARYICRRLCRRLVADNPPDRLVEEAAAVFLAQKDAPDQLKQVVRTILLSPEFRTTWGEKIKRPLEYSASILRGLIADFAPESPFQWSYEAMGQALFEWIPPDGYPDDRDAWSSTMPMLQRWRHCNWLFSWTYGGDGPDKNLFRIRPEEQHPAHIRTPNAIVDFWSLRLLGRTLPPEERDPVVNFMAGGRNPDYELPDDQLAERLRHMVALICLSPSFQWR